MHQRRQRFIVSASCLLIQLKNHEQPNFVGDSWSSVHETWEWTFRNRTCNVKQLNFLGDDPLPRREPGIGKRSLPRNCISHIFKQPKLTSSEIHSQMEALKCWVLKEPLVSVPVRKFLIHVKTNEQTIVTQNHYTFFHLSPSFSAHFILFCPFSFCQARLSIKDTQPLDAPLLPQFPTWLGYHCSVI